MYRVGPDGKERFRDLSAEDTIQFEKIRLYLDREYLLEAIAKIELEDHPRQG